MATEVNTVKINLKVFGNDELKKLNATFGKINKTLVLNKKSLNDTVASILRVDERARSFNGGLAKSNKIIRDQIEAFKVLRDQVDKGGASYSRFTAEIDKLNASLSIQPNANAYAFPIGPQMDTRGRFAKLRDRFIKSGKNMGVGQKAALGALAGSGLAGQLGAVGSFGLAGSIGGPIGTAVGVGLGAVAEGIGFAGEAATYASEIKKLQIALKGVTKDQKTFEKGLAVIKKTSKDLNVPIAASTKQFTTLSASVLGAGGTIEDAELVFTGVSNAIKATGGSADDVQSAIRAMSQIFGKGKVSAEELQGQLGERLAGAVVKFAEANGSSLQKLQKDLRDGTVGLDQVIKFAQKLNTDFGETARKVADSSADAGARLKVQMDNMKLAVGEAVLPIGAAFQSAFSEIVKGITESEETMKGIVGTFKTIGAAAFATFAAIRFLTRAFVDLVKITYELQQLNFVKAFKIADKGLRDTSATAIKDFDRLGNIFKTKEERDLTAPYTVNGITYDRMTGRVISQGAGGLPTLTGEDDGKNEEAAKNKIVELERTIKLKGIEDETDRKLLERQYKLIDAVREINKTYKDDDVNRQKLIDLENTNFQIDKTNILTGSIKDAKTEVFDLNAEFRKLISSTTDLETNIGKLALDVTNKLGDAFADFFIEGKKGFADLAKSAIKELNRIILKAVFMKNIANPVLEFLNLNANGNAIEKGEIVPSAMGNVFARNKIVPYKLGGIVNSPHIFPMKNGAGILGEAGPEGILPLKRGKDGKLGVIAQGGGVGNIVVNVDASGTSAEGDDKQSQAFGELLGSVVRTTIIEEQRPGGLLNS